MERGLWVRGMVMEGRKRRLSSQNVNRIRLLLLLLSHVRLFAAPWTAAHHAPPPMEFSRQEYWSWLPFSSPCDIPDPGIEPTSLVSPALAGGFFTTSNTQKVQAEYAEHIK